MFVTVITAASGESAITTHSMSSQFVVIVLHTYSDIFWIVISLPCHAFRGLSSCLSFINIFASDESNSFGYNFSFCQSKYFVLV